MRRIHKQESMIQTNIQQYFRYYLALAILIMLGVGVRMQAAPLGTGSLVKEETSTSAPVGNQVRTAPVDVATR
jgi:hypothetical protein